MGREGKLVFPVVTYYSGILRVLTFHWNAVLSEVLYLCRECSRYSGHSEAGGKKSFQNANSCICRSIVNTMIDLFLWDLVIFLWAAFYLSTHLFFLIALWPLSFSFSWLFFQIDLKRCCHLFCSLSMAAGQVNKSNLEKTKKSFIAYNSGVLFFNYIEHLNHITHSFQYKCQFSNQRPLNVCFNKKHGQREMYSVAPHSEIVCKHRFYIMWMFC